MFKKPKKIYITKNTICGKNIQTMKKVYDGTSKKHATFFISVF